MLDLLLSEQEVKWLKLLLRIYWLELEMKNYYIVFIKDFEIKDIDLCLFLD